MHFVLCKLVDDSVTWDIFEHQLLKEVRHNFDENKLKSVKESMRQIELFFSQAVTDHFLIIFDYH